MSNKNNQAGFTLIELLVVTAISLTLFALISINLGQVQTNANLASASNLLLADLRNQQIKAMTGNIGSTSTQQPQGIFINPSSFTLFANNYNLSDPNNFTETISPITISTTLPSNQVLFQAGSGEINAFNSSENTITLSFNGQSSTITLNALGVASQN